MHAEFDIGRWTLDVFALPATLNSQLFCSAVSDFDIGRWTLGVRRFSGPARHSPAKPELCEWS